MTENKYFQKNFGDPLDRPLRPTFGSRPTVWETLLYLLHVAADPVGCCCVLCDLYYHVKCLDSILLLTPFKASWTCFQCIKLNLPFADVDVIYDYDLFNLHLNMEKQNVIDKYLDPIDHDEEGNALLNEAGLDADLNFYNTSLDQLIL